MIFHKPDDDGNYTDEQLADHLITSDCSECVRAGSRFKQRKSVGVAAVLLERELGPPSLCQDVTWNHYVYLLERIDNGMHVLAGGKLENETPEEGIRRELVEELGHADLALRPLTFAANPDVPHSPIMLFFWTVLTGPQITKLRNAEPHKHRNLHRISVSNLPINMWGTDVAAIRLALKYV